MSDIYTKLASILKNTKCEPQWQMPDGTRMLTKLVAQRQLTELTREYMIGQVKLSTYEPHSDDWFTTIEYLSDLGRDIILLKEEIERFK